MQPEKFYEACVTYNIVDFYKSNTNKRVYPFSISQHKENKEGYDFGYEVDSNSFMIQYKRPENIKLDNKFTWKIDEEQLKTILNTGIDDKIFYCFPGFSDFRNWYEALKMTYFALPSDIYTYLERSCRKSISSNTEILKSWYDIYNLIENRSLRKGLVCLNHNNMNFVDKFMKVSNDGSVFYMIK